ncbi:hypothetical protein O181_018563 [Austropuccinia psidii MF-1]|uniref:Uncharacterized protein n=1 Tax=Austropuccinia psidii MF-1 TaxID=1389203 RepID=A0A9Q3C838_9BASI|nr:hypothetical protein [Austropuccinia psidii MF-1]
MEAPIQSNQMDLDREEARPNPDMASLPQERHVWRIPEFPPIPQVPVQRLVQRSQRRGVVNIPKPLAGGHELLLTHQELSRSGEDHRALRRMEPIVLKRKGQKYKELVEEPKSFIHRPEEGVGNESSLGERRPSCIYQLQASSINVQTHTQGTSEEAERTQESSKQGKRQSQLAQT